MSRVFVALALAGALAACGGPSTERADVPRYTIEQFLETDALTGGAFSPDEAKLLYGSDETGVFNAFEVSIDGGEPKQLTFSEGDAVLPLSYFPDDERILYMGDKGGNEIYHIFVRETDGAIKELTPGEKNRALFHGWAHDDKSFFLQSNQRDPQYMDLYEVAVADLKPKLIFRNEGYDVGPISDDKRYMALTKTITTHNSQLFFYDLRSKKMQELEAHTGNVNLFPVTFAPDSKTLYYVSDRDSEFSHLRKINVEIGDPETVAQPEWDVMYAGLSRNGKYLYWAVNADARTEMHVRNLESGDDVDLPDLPQGDLTGVAFSDSEGLMRFYHSGPRSPSNLYVAPVPGGEPVKLTNTLSPEIDPEDVVDAEVVRYESFDGEEIPAVLMKPHLAEAVKAPALVDVHGGPGGQSRVGYSDVYQYLANHGYVILRVNNRGSSGYGKTFYKADDRKHGEDDLQDVVYGKKYLQTLHYVDPEKIGIIGGSYGGYMVLAALAFEPEEFAAGVDIFGVANWLRTLQSIPPWWAAFRDALIQELGDPEKDEEYLRRISPLFHAKNITKPLIVLQGANDPRVLKVESDEIVEAVRSNGVPVEYVVFDDEGHGFTKKANRIEGYRAIREFLDLHLKGEGGVEAADARP